MTSKEEIKLLKEKISQMDIKLAAIERQAGCDHQWYSVPGVCLRCNAHKEFTNAELESMKFQTQMNMFSVAQQAELDRLNGRTKQAEREK